MRVRVQVCVMLWVRAWGLPFSRVLWCLFGCGCGYGCGRGCGLSEDTGAGEGVLWGVTGVLLKKNSVLL